MCLAMYRPKGVSVDDSIYINGFENNDDGGGFAYVDVCDDGKSHVVVDKGFMNIESFLEAIHQHDGKEMLIHFRRVSVGEVSEANCHPFRFYGKMHPQYSFAVIHNGTLPITAKDKKSDTRTFVDEVLAPLFVRDPEFLDWQPGGYMLDSVIGTNNKVAIMRHDTIKDETKVYLLNYSKWSEAFGCMMSNTSYMKKVTYVAPTFQHHGVYSGQDSLRDWYANKEKVAADDKASFDDKYDLKGWSLNTTTNKWEKDIEQEVITDQMSLIELVIHKELEEEDTNRENMKDAEIAMSQAEAEMAEVTGAVEAEAEIIPMPTSIREIVVPRDADKVKRLDDTSTSHLNNKQLKKLRRLCDEYAESLGMPSYQKSNIIQKLQWVRDDLRVSLECLREADHKAIDLWLLKSVYAMEATLGRIDNENKIKLRAAARQAKQEAQKTN